MRTEMRGLACAAAVACGLFRLGSAQAQTPVTTVASTAISPLKSGDHAPLVVVVLRPHGFEPATLTLSDNTFVLMVINQAGGAADPDFTLTDAALPKTAAALHTSKASQNGVDTWRILTLPKGTYTASLSNHSKATLTIEVTK